MFINENLEPVKLTDVTLPSAALFKLYSSDPPIFGLLGIYEGQKQVIHVKKNFIILQADDDIFQQQQPHPLFSNIEIIPSLQTDSCDNKVGSLVRTGSKLQIIAKSHDLTSRAAGFKAPDTVKVTLKDDYGNLDDKTVYYSNWQVFRILNDPNKDKEKICEKNDDTVEINTDHLV